MFAFLRPADLLDCSSTSVSHSTVDWVRYTHSSAQAMKRNPPIRAFGFTLIEMMVTVAILGILIALAAPSFAILIDRWRVIATAESLQSTLHFARAEAIKRGGRIGIQKIANNTDGCILAETDQDWGCGWLVYADTNGNGKWDNGDETLMSTKASPNTTVAYSRNSRPYINLSRWGQIDGMGAAGFTIKSSARPQIERGVCISTGGRIRIIEVTPCPN